MCAEVIDFMRKAIEKFENLSREFPSWQLFWDTLYGYMYIKNMYDHIKSVQVGHRWELYAYFCKLIVSHL